MLAGEGGELRAVGDIGTHWIDAASFILGQRVDALFATLETFHKTRKRPRGEVKTFAKVDPKKMISFPVDTEDFASVLLQHAESGVPANVAILPSRRRMEMLAGDRRLRHRSQYALGPPAAE